MSVILPTYNRSGYLHEAIDSVFSQSYSNFELIVVDDASTDGTGEQLQRIGDRVRVLRHEERRGSPAARNTGIRSSRGSFIAFIDSDDKWTPDKLQKQMNVLTSRRVVGMVGGGTIPIDNEGAIVGDPTYGPDRLTYEDFCIRDPLPGGPSNAVLRREIFDEVGLFDESLLRNQDRDLWIRVSRHYKVVCVPDVTLYKRWHHDDSRPDAEISVMEQCRRKINSRIDDPVLRRKAEAWTWFHLYIMSRIQPDEDPRYSYVLKSFVAWPFKIPGVEWRLRTLGRSMVERVRSNILFLT